MTDRYRDFQRQALSRLHRLNRPVQFHLMTGPEIDKTVIGILERKANDRSNDRPVQSTGPANDRSNE